MTDKELLEKAASAAGIAVQWNESWNSFERDARPVPAGYSEFVLWRPLSDDGDALRLAVDLQLDIEFFNGNEVMVLGAAQAGGDKYADARRAVVRAAARLAAK